MSGLCVYYHHRKLRGVVEPVVGGFDLVYNNGPVKPPTSLSTSGMRRRGGCAWARGGPLGVVLAGLSVVGWCAMCTLVRA